MSLKVKNDDKLEQKAVQFNVTEPKPTVKGLKDFTTPNKKKTIKKHWWSRRK